MSLRGRLIAALIALAAVGLITLAAVTYAEQRSFLFERVDQQARDAQRPVTFQLAGPAIPGIGGGGPAAPAPPPPRARRRSTRARRRQRAAGAPKRDLRAAARLERRRDRQHDRHLIRRGRGA